MIAGCGINLSAMKNILYTTLIAMLSLAVSSCEARVEGRASNDSVPSHSFAEHRFNQETQTFFEEWVMENVTITLNVGLGNEHKHHADRAVVTTNSRGNIQLIFFNKDENKIYYVQNQDFSISKG